MRPLPARRMLRQQMRLGRGVQGAGRLVENEHARVADDGPGHGDQLALAQRQAGAALAEHGLVALGQAADELVGADEAGGGDDRAPASGRRRPCRCSRRRCRRTAAPPAAPRRSAAGSRPATAGEVLPVEQHPARLGRLEPEQQPDQRALARARRPGDAQHRAGRRPRSDTASSAGALRAGIAERRPARPAAGPGRRISAPASRPLASPRSAISSSRRRHGLPRLPELAPGQRELAHGRQRAGGEDRGRHQGADGHVAGHDHPRAEIDQDQRGQMLQRLAEAAGDMGDAPGLQPGPRAAQQMAARSAASCPARGPAA